MWAFSSDVRFGPNKMNATLSFLPGFIAKTQKVDRPETALNPVTIPSLSSLVGRDLQVSQSDFVSCSFCICACAVDLFIWVKGSRAKIVFPSIVTYDL